MTMVGTGEEWNGLGAAWERERYWYYWQHAPLECKSRVGSAGVVVIRYGRTDPEVRASLQFPNQ